MIRVLVVILLFMGLACKSQDKGKSNGVNAGEQSQKLTLLLRDNYGGTEDADFRVIRDKKTLRQFFVQVNKTRKPGLPIPEVDFSQEQLVLYCPGKRMNGGTPELIIKENTPEKMILMVESSKSEQKMGLEALTMPFILYKLPLSEKEIILQKK